MTMRKCLCQELHEALSLFRSLVKEGGVPRYTVTPGAALNTVIEQDVDPVLRRAEMEIGTKATK